MVTGASADVFSLLAAYLAPCRLAALAVGRVPDKRVRMVLGAYAVVAGLAWITLQIRQFFHPDGMALLVTPIEAAELWGWSGGWLVRDRPDGSGHPQRSRAIADDRAGRIGLVCVKVFAVDMSGLTGLWRVLSFLGLGMALIGLGVAYRRFVLPDKQGQAG